MKKILYAVAILALGVNTACGGNGENDGEKTDSLTAAPVKKVKAEAFAATTNIRYIDRDSLLVKFDYSRNTMDECHRIAVALQQYQNELGAQLQSKQNAIQEKVKSNGYLSEASYNADLKELQNLARTLQTRYAARADKDNRRINELTKAASDYIDNFLVEYNKTKKYDAILDRAAGLYFNPALDITGEVVKALNEAYSKTKENKEEKK